MDDKKQSHMCFLKATLGIRYGEKLAQKLTQKRERLCLGMKHQELGACFELIKVLPGTECVWGLGDSTENVVTHQGDFPLWL